MARRISGFQLRNRHGNKTPQIRERFHCLRSSRRCFKPRWMEECRYVQGSLLYKVKPDSKVLVCTVPAQYKPTSVAQFCRSGLLPMSEMPWHTPMDPYIDTSRLYLAGILRASDETRRAANKDPLLHLLPILQIQCDTIAGDLGYHHEILHRHIKDRDTLTSNHEALEVSWRELRSLLRLGPKPFHVYKDFDRHKNGKRSCRDKGYRTLLEDFSRLMSEAHNLEQLARDYVQLSVGILSLAESRASIKQSKIALEESKRTKLGMFHHPSNLCRHAKTESCTD